LLVRQFAAAKARFRGAEFEIAYAPESGAGVRLFADTVRGKLAGGANLPRISPTRFGADVSYRRGSWRAEVSAMRVQSQSRVAPLETATPGYTRVDAEVSRLFTTGAGTNLTVYLQGKNLGDKDIRAHTSFLKETAPLPGRGWLFGLRGEF
jgi:iron complex outermembrane receptor protein